MINNMAVKSYRNMLQKHVHMCPWKYMNMLRLTVKREVLAKSHQGDKMGLKIYPIRRLRSKKVN